MTTHTLFRGLPACDCLIRWIPKFEEELKARALIKNSIDIAQLIGGAAASGGTHATGGALDIWQTDVRVSRVARWMGCVMWPRVTGSFATNKHSHGVLRGCPHNTPARYQIVAADKGFNGLGTGGMGGPDPVALRGALNDRSWQEGLAWQDREVRLRKIDVRLEELRAEKRELKEKQAA